MDEEESEGRELEREREKCSTRKDRRERNRKRDEDTVVRGKVSSNSKAVESRKNRRNEDIR